MFVRAATRVGTLWFLMLVGVLWLLAAPIVGCNCSGSKGNENNAKPPELPHVKLILNWVAEPEFGGFYAARESGAFRREGLDVEVVGGGAGVPVVQMVASGKAEFGIAGGDEVVIARARGVDIIPIFATYQTSPRGIMAHASRGAKGLGDVFAAGSLAVEPGAAFAAFLKKKYGFDKLKIVPYDGGVSRFVADKELAQQCYVTSEPMAAKRKGADPQVFLVADEGYNPYETVVITSKAYWKDHADLVRKFVRATRVGWKTYLGNPEPTNAVMSKLNSAMDAQTFREAATAQKLLIVTGTSAPIGSMTRERWEKLANELVELKVIDKAPPVDDYLVAIEK